MALLWVAIIPICVGRNELAEENGSGMRNEEVYCVVA